jgi:hemolysin III
MAETASTGLEIVRQQLREEIANSISHGIAAIFAVIGLVLLLRHATMFQDVWQAVGFSLYGGSLTLVFVSSTIYHAVQHPPLKRVFRILDHCAIFLLIAGTYTPFTIVIIRGTWGWFFFCLIWVASLSGVVLKIGYMDQFQRASKWIYLGMGWFGLVALYPLFEVFSSSGILWLFVGGMLYTVGVVFYVWEKLPFNHFIWHLFVMAGALCHFMAVYNHISPADVLPM